MQVRLVVVEQHDLGPNRDLAAELAADRAAGARHQHALAGDLRAGLRPDDRRRAPAQEAVELQVLQVLEAGVGSSIATNDGR